MRGRGRNWRDAATGVVHRRRTNGDPWVWCGVQSFPPVMVNGKLKARGKRTQAPVSCMACIVRPGMPRGWRP